MRRRVIDIQSAGVWARQGLFLALTLAAGAAAESFSGGLSGAAALLRDGDAAAALRAYRELEVEHPDSTPVLFGIGCAQYAAAEAQAADNPGEAARPVFEEARNTFERIPAADTTVRAHAAYNAANCLVWAARTYAVPAEYEAKVAMLRRAVAAYEEVVRNQPDHARALQNLDHARFELKKLLQHPPEKQDQPQNPPPQEPPKAISLFRRAVTEIPGAQANILPDKHIVELVPPESEGKRP